VLYGYEGLKRVDIAEASAGELVAMAGIDAIEIGETVADADDLRRLIDSRSPGDELELRVRRGDETVTVDVELGTRPPS
jgi:predicted membrane GTPase involved in stress response